ncbi:MAG: hypothetical protein QOG50_2706 [Actinomycetota bacterium]|nr:hypothetical protein [Actinomycetota bacterium]
MEAFVTGATGFIGSRIVRRLLAAGSEVTVLVRAGSNTVRIADVLSDVRQIDGDVRATDSFAHLLRPFDTCIHSAWYAEPGKYLRSPENGQLVGATLELAQRLVSAGCGRFVGVGTCYEYDTGTGLLTEDSPTQPTTPYAAAKLATATALRRVPDLETAWIRLFWQYGPYEDERRLVPAIVTALLREHRAASTSGHQVRDFLHVDDVAAAVVAVANSQATGVVNVGSGKPVTVRHVVEAIGAATGRADLLDIGGLQQADGEPEVVYADNQRLRSLGWTASYGLAEGIADTVQWWRSRFGM